MGRLKTAAGLALLASVAGCSSTPAVTPSVEGWNNVVQQYMARPANRALAANIAPDSNEPYRYYWVWSSPSPQAAERDALDLCDRSLVKDHTRPGACLLIATNGTFHVKREELTPDRFRPRS
ncbi:MAG TPA: hypothetical protein VFA50_04440 [Stellaceae bacterium]|nr:hypothetical protein [Stellaceae bacterium]